MKNLITRSISGVVYVALIVGALLCGHLTTQALMSIFAGLGIYEFHKLTDEGKINRVTLILDIVVAVLMIWVRYEIIMLFIMLRMAYAVFDKRPDAYKITCRSIFALAYIALPLSFVGQLETELALLMFIMIWLNDTGAYCVGSLLGKHRLCERLSPKKSWEGFLGGLVFCIAAGIVASYILTDAIYSFMIITISLGVVVCVFATVGDLFESLIKRTLHVKDSGNLIPGHGGILDRIDSLLFVAPAVFFFYALVMSLLLLMC